MLEERYTVFREPFMCDRLMKLCLPGTDDKVIWFRTCYLCLSSRIEFELLMLTVGGVTWVVNASLDDIVQGESAGRLLVPQVGVHFGREHLGHVVVVLAEVGVLLLRRVLQLQLVVGVSKRHDDVRAARLPQSHRLQSKCSITQHYSIKQFMYLHVNLSQTQKPIAYSTFLNKLLLNLY